jgi:hypothetical protein
MSMNASSPTPEVPLEIEPLVGWRVWKLGRTFLGDLRLRAIVHQHEWEPQTVEPAQCAARVYHSQFHEAPSEQCSCGYYAADSIKSLAASQVFSNGAGVIGAIAMWGSVIQHAKGARSQFAYPARLRLVCSRCLADGVVVDPTVVVDGRAMEPLCDKHSKGASGQLLPADQVEAELLSTYAVELLPKPVLPKLRSSPRVNNARDGLSMVFGVIFLLLRLVIGWMVAMWILGLVLSVIALVVSALTSPFTGSDAPSPTPTVVVTQPPHLTSDAGRWHLIAPHRGTPPPRSMPKLAFPCGVGHGDTVELVSCVDPLADLIGLAMREAPHGMAHDCIPSDVAYSRGPNWWACWFPLGDPWVHPWPNAPNPFHSDGGAS